MIKRFSIHYTTANEYFSACRKAGHRPTFGGLTMYAARKLGLSMQEAWV